MNVDGGHATNLAVSSKYAGAHESRPLSHDSSLNHSDNVYQTYNTHWNGLTSSPPQWMPDNADSNTGKPLATSYVSSATAAEQLGLHFLLQNGRETSSSPIPGAIPATAARPGSSNHTQAVRSTPPYPESTASPDPSGGLEDWH